MQGLTDAKARSNDYPQWQLARSRSVLQGVKLLNTESFQAENK